MTSKYAEDIREIKTDMKHVLGHLEKLNASQRKQWEQINANEGNIKVLDSRVNTWAGIQTALSAGLAAIAAWLGMRK